MEELTSALNAHKDQMADLVEKLTAELRSSLTPAYNNFMGFFHAIDWRVLTCIVSIFLLIFGIKSLYLFSPIFPQVLDWYDVSRGGFFIFFPVFFFGGILNFFIEF